MSEVTGLLSLPSKKDDVHALDLKFKRLIVENPFS